MYERSQQRLEILSTLWETEQQAIQQQFVEQRKELNLRERVERGLALRNLTLVETDAVVGERLLLWLSPQQPESLDNLQMGSGDPVRLWWDHPDQEDAVLGVLSRRKDQWIGVVVDSDYPERLDEGEFHLDGDAPTTTFERGKRAIQRFLDAKKGSELAHIREILWGDKPAEFAPPPTLTWFDHSLNPSQHAAVLRSLSANDIALIHGPPGTGKTRTLVEIVRQAINRGEKILVTSASNAAVDNLAERLIAEQIPVVRLGHPARVSSSVESHTLDAWVEATGAYALSRQWIMQANQLRRKANTRNTRNAPQRAEKRELLQEASALMRDARQQRQGVQQAILDKHRVLCATAAGSDLQLLKDLVFDRVIVDEATQIPDPIALIALARARKAVLAGDPCQLPPTIISQEAARQGLSVTLFEQLAAHDQSDALRLLNIQYRMHKQIMAFPSQSMYHNQLIAHDSVAHHQLSDLPNVAEDPIRSQPFLFIDTAGKGWEEKKIADDPSTSNPQQAERMLAEVRRLLGRGISPRDVAIITPYNAQVRWLRDHLASEITVGLEIGSVDSFQGREKEAILIDLVRSNESSDIGFLSDTRRMNVALTRARRFLLVLGDSATLAQHPYYEQFLQFTQSHNAWQSAWDDEAPPFEP